MLLSHKLEALIRAKGWTEREFARRMEVEASSYRAWKKNEKMPDNRVSKAADLLETNEAYLRGETDDPSPNKDGAPSPRQLQERMRALERLKIVKPDGTLDEERLAIADAFLDSIEAIKRKGEKN